MCTSLGKFFSCTQAAEEEREHSRQDDQQGYNFDERHRQQLMALSNLSAEAMAQRRRPLRPKQPPPPLPQSQSHPARATGLKSRQRERERERDNCNSYTAMERHDQILEDNAEQL